MECNFFFIVAPTLAADLSVEWQAAPPAHLRLLSFLARVKKLLHRLGSQALEVVVVNLREYEIKKTQKKKEKKMTGNGPKGG